MTTHQLYPFHEDATAASALGRLLVRRASPDPEPFDALADSFGVDPVRLETAVYRLGVESEIEGLPGRVDPETVPYRTAPASLAGRDPVVRERDGIRDPEARTRADPTRELSFEAWVLVEATKVGRRSIRRRLTDTLGDDAETLSVQTRAVVGAAPFPERVLFVGVAYPVNANGPGEVSAVQEPPPFPFGDVEAAPPNSIDVRVASGDETFVVRNLPVVPLEEYRTH